MTETELLKSLVGYLPYGLKGLFETRDVMPATSQNETRVKTLKVDNVEFFVKYCVPILYPLSSLIEKIKVNGEEFVPLEKLFALNLENNNPEWGTVELYSDTNSVVMDFEITNKDQGVFRERGSFYYSILSKSFALYINQPIHVGNQLNLFQKLYEWKIDIENLIESGHAIGVTTLTTNPYE